MSDSEPEIIILVDSNDEITSHKDRKLCGADDIYRVSALWITNSAGKILLARRHKNKKHHPRKWGPAVAGTVNKGETYSENIIQEAKEELGIVDVSFKVGPKTAPSGKFKHFTQWFIAIIDAEIDYFTIQEDEVEEIKWWNKEELIKSFKKNPEEFLSKVRKYLEMLD
ncbi:NUDIX domain-containing protein [Candidatus Woesearchaeota archaeon]|jgi:isopentenyldiphosphate isomerase|nr:NUDIX domain-containing protein [Candidatus Woesearchaeota archaeon]MBT6518524.1 NUDIX domain-containing protein [Candidatus Woesearchaeota archaeon]MBT7368396.1 NUDIX domain-containing protein [Candidatus Woesearchaeota archaeon]